MQERPLIYDQDLLRNEATIQFPSLKENIAFARMVVALLAAQIDFTVDQIEDIKLAVSEAVSNTCIHGYKEAPGPVKLTVQVYADRLHVVVADDGAGIADIDWALQPGNTTGDNCTGMGLVFIQAYMDRFDIQSAPGQGTRIGMTKMLAPGQEH